METTTTATPTLEERYRDYQRDGFTIFEGLYDADMMQALHEEFAYQQRRAKLAGAEGMATWWFGNMLERAPELMWQFVSKPELLDFAEQVMGPYVQMDNLTLAGFPSNDRSEFMKPVNWHRDRWAHLPLGVYERPNSINMISYGQELTEASGPLRVLPGSHILPQVVDEESRRRPHPDEVLVHAKPGDVILTHNLLIHSGTKNTSGKTRLFFSMYFNQTWMKPTDNLNGPGIASLIHNARARNDRRALRLLGVDELIKQRNNWGYFRPDEEQFAEWIAEDKALVQEPEA